MLKLLGQYLFMAHCALVYLAPSNWEINLNEDGMAFYCEFYDKNRLYMGFIIKIAGNLRAKLIKMEAAS